MKKKKKASLESDFEVKIGMQITRTRIKISTFGNVRTGYAFRAPSGVASGRNYARMSIVGEAGESSRTDQVIEIRRYASWTSTNVEKEC